MCITVLNLCIKLIHMETDKCIQTYKHFLYYKHGKPPTCFEGGALQRIYNKNFWTIAQMQDTKF